MPQIVLGRNYGGGTSLGASDLQTAAFLKAIDNSRIDNDRADAGLAKAKSFMQKYNMAVGSEITSADGVTNNNALVDRRAKPQTENLSRAAGGQMKQVITKTAAQKNAENVAFMDAQLAKINNRDDNKITEDIVNAKPPVYTTSGSGGFGGGSGPGTSNNSSASRGENFNESSQYSAGTINSAEDDYFVDSNYNQRFDDRFGFDTQSARMLSELEGISAAYAGQEYDPSKDVYLQGALQRDSENAAANLNDFNQNMAKRAFVQGGFGTIAGPGESNAFGTGYNSSGSKGTSEQIPPGYGDKEDEDVAADIIILDPDGNEINLEGQAHFVKGIPYFRADIGDKYGNIPKLKTPVKESVIKDVLTKNISVLGGLEADDVLSKLRGGNSETTKMEGAKLLGLAMTAPQGLVPGGTQTYKDGRLKIFDSKGNLVYNYHLNTTEDSDKLAIDFVPIINGDMTQAKIGGWQGLYNRSKSGARTEVLGTTKENQSDDK